jgi:DNA-binding NarL/FixJ family response regulator
MGEANHTKKRVLVVDDHPLFRQAVVTLLSQQVSELTVHEAESSNRAFDLLIQESHWDLIVLDLSMPGRDGLDFLKDIKREHPQVPVLMLSAHPVKEFAVRCIRAGASGYMNKHATNEEISNALSALLKGGKYITTDVAEELAIHLEQGTGNLPAHSLLSDREFQILRNIAEGRTVSEVADALGLSTKTVSTYRSRLLKKLNMDNNAQLMQYAIKHDLTE